MTKTILALEKDLFFAVRIHDTLRHHNLEATTVRNLHAFEQRLEGARRPDLVIVNISTQDADWEAAIRTARAHNCPVLAFGSHMDLEARNKALQAGAQKVVANSKFTSDMLGLVTSMIDQAGTTSNPAEEEEKEE